MARLKRGTKHSCHTFSSISIGLDDALVETLECLGSGVLLLVSGLLSAGCLFQSVCTIWDARTVNMADIVIIKICCYLQMVGLLVHRSPVSTELIHKLRCPILPCLHIQA